MVNPSCPFSDEIGTFRRKLAGMPPVGLVGRTAPPLGREGRWGCNEVALETTTAGVDASGRDDLDIENCTDDGNDWAMVVKEECCADGGCSEDTDNDDGASTEAGGCTDGDTFTFVIGVLLIGIAEIWVTPAVAVAVCTMGSAEVVDSFGADAFTTETGLNFTEFMMT